MPHKTKGDANGTMPHGMFFWPVRERKGEERGEGGEGALEAEAAGLGSGMIGN